MLPTCHCCVLVGKWELAEFRTALHSISPKHFPALILASGLSRVPHAHSSEMRWWKVASASAPPWEPTPRCCIATVKAAIFSSLSGSSRLETHFRGNSPIWMGRAFCGPLDFGRAWRALLGCLVVGFFFCVYACVVVCALLFATHQRLVKNRCLRREWMTAAASGQRERLVQLTPTALPRLARASPHPSTESSTVTTTGTAEEKRNGEQPMKQSLPRLPKDRRDTTNSD